MHCRLNERRRNVGCLQIPGETETRVIEPAVSLVTVPGRGPQHRRFIPPRSTTPNANFGMTANPNAAVNWCPVPRTRGAEPYRRCWQPIDLRRSPHTRVRRDNQGETRRHQEMACLQNESRRSLPRTRPPHLFLIAAASLTQIDAPYSPLAFDSSVTRPVHNNRENRILDGNRGGGHLLHAQHGLVRDAWVARANSNGAISAAPRVTRRDRRRPPKQRCAEADAAHQIQ